MACAGHGICQRAWAALLRAAGLQRRECEAGACALAQPEKAGTAHLCAVDVKDHPVSTGSIHQTSSLLVRGERATQQIIEKERAQCFDGGLFKEAHFSVGQLPITPRCASRGIEIGMD